MLQWTVLAVCARDRSGREIAIVICEREAGIGEMRRHGKKGVVDGCVDCCIAGVEEHVPQAEGKLISTEVQSSIRCLANIFFIVEQLTISPPSEPSEA